MTMLSVHVEKMKHRNKDKNIYCMEKDETKK